MDSDKIKELEEIEKKYKAKNQYINNYIKNNYDRVVLLLKPGTKEKLEEKAKKLGFKSVNDFLKNLIEKDLVNDIENSPAAAGSDFFPDYKPTKTKLYEIPAGDDLETITQAQAETPKETDAAPAENGLDNLLAEISKNHGLL